MGLDMYLEKHNYVKRWEHQRPEERFEVLVYRGDVPFDGIKPERISSVVERVAYWRKANAVHRWFVENVQGGEDDCRLYDVSFDQLKALLSLCEAALVAEDPSEILPVQPGFFFGSTEYGESYRDDLKETKRQLEPLLAEAGADLADYRYQSSW